MCFEKPISKNIQGHYKKLFTRTYHHIGTRKSPPDDLPTFLGRSGYFSQSTSINILQSSTEIIQSCPLGHSCLLAGSTTNGYYNQRSQVPTFLSINNNILTDIDTITLADDFAIVSDNTQPQGLSLRTKCHNREQGGNH